MSDEKKLDGELLVRTADDTVPVASGEAHVMVMP